MTRIHTGRTNEDVGLKAVRREMQAVYALRPSISQAIEIAQRALYTDGTLSARLRELIRLRIGFHNQCRTCMAVRYEPEAVSEDLVCSLERPAEAADLTPAERAALGFADLFATNHLAIDDAVYDGLRAHFTEGELVELGFLCAMFVGTGRLAATWNIVEVLPDSFRATDGKVTPWGHEQTLRFRR